ncbi:MAG: DsrE family protein [Bacteroidales bacterium]|nr:DsrE family protein [Bacteroidales bacterium]
MKILFIINDTPYGTEKAYNALRLGIQILKDNPGTELNIFLLADAIGCGVAEQKTPDGYYNIGRMMKIITREGGKIKVCGTCMDARGINEQMLQSGVQRSNLKEFAEWTVEADKILSF